MLFLLTKRCFWFFNATALQLHFDLLLLDLLPSCYFLFALTHPTSLDLATELLRDKKINLTLRNISILLILKIYLQLLLRQLSLQLLLHLTFNNRIVHPIVRRFLDFSCLLFVFGRQRWVAVDYLTWSIDIVVADTKHFSPWKWLFGLHFDWHFTVSVVLIGPARSERVGESGIPHDFG